MATPTMALELDGADRALTDRLRKLAAETDRIEAYQIPHATRLAELAEAVAKRLGLHSHDLLALKYAALAHDLGERKLRRDYLQRPSGLNWEEQLDLWRHPILGEQEAQNLKLPRETQLLIRWHHEWWNGTGYPDGLAGTAIPLGARILRAVDTYCALNADRPQRGAYDWQTAEQLLSEQAGIECDPQVVVMLLSVLAAERQTQEIHQINLEPQSYETAPMMAITTDVAASSAHAEFADAQQTAAPSPLQTDLTEEVPAFVVNEGSVQPAPAEKTEEPAAPVEPPPPPKVSFDAPTLRPGVKPPAPPVPPPAPLWSRFVQAEPPSDLATTPPTVAPAPMIETEAVDLTSPTASLTGVGVTPAQPVWSDAQGYEPTEEIRALTPAELAAARMPSGSLAGQEATPVVPSHINLLQVIPLSEVPDHFWLVAKWIYTEWWETPDNSISVVSNPLKEHLASSTVPQTFVALSNGQPVGSVSLVANDVPECPDLSPWIGSLYVLPEHRGQGIGTRLLEGAFLRAKMQGAEAVYLATPAHTEFFARLGWQVLEREVGPRRLTVMMRVS